MDKKNIESAAISEVKDSILCCDILSPYISENDKEPSWDGFIYLYKDKGRKKENIQGRVAIQVKGELNSNFSLLEISHPADIADLKNYIKDNGVIYFVVYINKQNPRQRKLYYETLTPVKLALKLKSNENKTSLNIKLREFPSEPGLQKVIFLNFLKDSRQQVSYSPHNIISINEVNQNNVKGFTYLPENYKSFTNTQSLFNALNNNEIYFYVSDENKNLIPTDFFTSSERKLGIVDTVVDCPISIKDKVYYNDFKRVFSEDTMTIHIGNCMLLSINEQGGSKFDFKLTSSARKNIDDLAFYVEAVKNGCKFSIRDKEFSFTIINSTIEDHLIFLEGKLTFLNRVIDLFNILNIDGDLNLDTLSTSDEIFLDILFRAFLNKEDVDISVEGNASVTNLQIANIHLKLTVFKKETGLYTIKDFFNPELQATRINENGDVRLVSPFSILEKEDYISVSNINHEVILNSYKSLSQFDYIYQIAILDMLKMLSAYDDEPNEKLFNLIKNISDWIFDESKDNIPIEIKLLNRLQIIKRERIFNEEEKSQLVELSENPNIECKLAANILLGYKDAANIYFNRLTNQEQEVFKSFPIYKLLERTI